MNGNRRKAVLVPIVTVIAAGSLFSTTAGASKSSLGSSAPRNHQIGHAREDVVIPSLRTAEKIETAPGLTGVFVDLIVIGKNTHVDRADLRYQPGANPGSLNICGITLEISYTEANGEKKTEAQDPPCSIGISWALFPFNRDLQDGRQFCGRVKVNAVWSNSACVTIHS